MNDAHERVVTFGTAAKLVGIVAEPAADADPAAPVFLMLNAGVLHRVGSCRLHVRIARALAACGYASLRFDYSGVGDSAARDDALPFEQRAVVETREAMDYLERTRGARRFVLLGLCSGADMGHRTALADPRVAGLVLFDGWVHRTWRHYARHYLPRVLRWRVWQNALRVRWEMIRGVRRDRFAPPTVGEGEEYEPPAYERVFPAHAILEREFQMLAARRLPMFCLWTGGLPEYNYRGQFGDSFRRVRFGALLDEHYLPDSDHIITNLEHQAQVVEHVVQWAAQHYPATTAMREALAATGD